jgi:hypothetical protein
VLPFSRFASQRVFHLEGLADIDADERIVASGPTSRVFQVLQDLAFLAGPYIADLSVPSRMGLHISATVMLASCLTSTLGRSNTPLDAPIARRV